MWRLALLLWVMGGTVLAGICVTIVLLSPSLQPMKFIPIGALAGAIAAIPLAIAAAKSIASKTG